MSGPASDDEYRPSYIVGVPRTSRRQSLEECKTIAMAIAARQGITDEPDIEPYDGWPRGWGGPMEGPQGYRFRWPVDSD